MTRKRADVLLVEKGVFDTRAKAQAAIIAGGVTADGSPVEKPGQLLPEAARLEAQAAHPYVSRAGLKLAHALGAFQVDPAGRVCLDLGASTGGFVQVLRQAGARLVYASDVGTGQLHPLVKADPGVADLSPLDARALHAGLFSEPPSLITADVSFIGLRKVLEPALALAAPTADVIALVKPQFEAGPGDPLAVKRDRRGVLPDDAARAIAARTIESLDGLRGFALQTEADSPIRGGEGALERLVHLRRGP